MEDHHPRDRFAAILFCPAELVDRAQMTHQCMLKRGGHEEHECSCGRKWENPE